MAGTQAKGQVESFYFEAVKMGVDGKPTGETRCGFYHKNWLVQMRVRLALWLASDFLTGR
jgi:hypothetical protein